MKYENTMEGIFLERPNRFIAVIEIGGRPERCHVKNTGRCRELLIPGVKVIVQFCGNPARKTEYDLIAVWKGRTLINMDSQAPNRVVYEMLQEGRLLEKISLIKPEKVFRRSRFDFYVETENRKIYMEVKGVTLEEKRNAYFPDAPTERGVKHLNELRECVREGSEAYVIFVVQMKGIQCFLPNRHTHPAFADALVFAQNAGVKVLAFDCRVTENSMQIDEKIPVILQEEEMR